MKKLDNRGWSFESFVLILLLLFGVILLISFLANEFDKNFPRTVTSENIEFVIQKKSFN